MMEHNQRNNFCDDMRKATREIHTISDAMVNAKLALGLHVNKVWADGLLIFYEIFKVLERNIETQKSCHLDRFQFLNDLQRGEAFEDDLNFYLGSNWTKSYTPRESVEKYINHLHDLEKSNPILLMAYIYHLYMGLLSGGIILRKKRELLNKIMPFKLHNFNINSNNSENNDNNDNNYELDGNRITYFGNLNIYNLKKQIKKVTNEIANTCDDDTKKLLIEESKMVFILNNQIIRTVDGVGAAILKKIIYILLILMLILAIYLFFF